MGEGVLRDYTDAVHLNDGGITFETPKKHDHRFAHQGVVINYKNKHNDVLVKFRHYRSDFIKLLVIKANSRPHMVHGFLRHFACFVTASVNNFPYNFWIINIGLR